MQINGKRICALVLALAILCTLLPVGTVFAAQEQELTTEAYAQADLVFDLIDEAEASPATRSATQEQKTLAAMEVVMASESYVEGSLELSGNSFTWWTDSGIRCVYSPRMRKLQSEMNQTGEDAIVNEPVATRGGTPSGTEVYLVGPYYGYDSSFTSQYKNEARRVAKAIGDTDGYTLYSGTAATVDKVAEAVSNGAVVFFDSHGTTDYENPYDEYDFITGATCSYLCLTSTSGLTAQDYEDGALYDSEGAFVNGTVIANHMTSNSPNGILWMAICLGMGTDTMYKPLREMGVEVVYGYSESVTFDGDYLYEETFWEQMNSGSTVAEAVAAMKSKWGNWDWSTQIAEASGYNDGYATISEAREDFCAFPVVVSSEDTFPGKRTTSSYGADSLQTVQSTYSLGEVQEITVPTDPKEILEEAYALGANEELDYEVTLTGTVTAVTTAYSSTYGNVTVIMTVEGCEDMPVKCYRLEGSGADQIGVGDTITVTGTLVNYQHSSGDLEVEFQQGCTLDSWVDNSTGDSGSDDSGSASDPVEPEGAVSGSYYIAAERSDTYFYMTNDLGTANNKRYTAVDSGLTSLPASIENAEDSKTFTVIDNGDGTYSIYNASGYLTWTSGNTGNFATAVADGLKVTETSNGDGTVSFHFTASDGERYLALNSTAGNDYFAWYKQTSNQLSQLYLVPVSAGSEDTSCQHANTTTTTVDATCTENGSAKVVCDDCGETVSTQTIEATGHTDVDSDEVCDDCDTDLSTGAQYVGILMSAAPADGDTIVIVNNSAANGIKAMTATASGTKLAGETATVDGGTLTLTDTMAQLTVSIDGSGYYTFVSADGKYLTSATTGNGLSLADTASDYSLWTVEAATDGTFYITNVNATYNGTSYNQALEYYSGFTTYGVKASDIYYMSLYKVTELKEDCQHENTTVTGAAAATCNLAGYTGDTVCSDCGAAISEGTVIDANGHSMEGGICTVCGAAEMITQPEMGVAYKWGVEQNNLSRTYYFTGAMNGYYGATSAAYAEGVDVYLEEAEGGCYIYFMDENDVKQYVNIVISGTYSNFTYGETADTVYTYDEAYNTMVATVEDAQRYIGSYNSYNTFSVSYYSYLDGSSNFPAHFYAIAVSEGDGEEDPGQGVVTPMAAPVLTTAVDAVTGNQLLTWNEDPNATAYEIYRATKKTGTYTLVDTVAGDSWQDPDATVGKTYYYQVKAINAEEPDRNSELSAIVSITHKCAAPIVTAEPNEDTGKVVLTWDKVSGAKKYEVYRATSEDGKYSKVTTTTKSTYTDSKGSVGREYFYKVRAVASSSKYNSAYSAVVSGSAVCAKASVSIKLDTATGKPSLSWSKVSGAASYRILRQLPGEEDFTLLTTVEKNLYVDLTAPIDTQCSYKVQAIGADETLNGAASAPVSVVAGLARPVLTGALDSVSGKSTVSWERVEGAVSYEIYRSTKSSKSYKQVATTASCSYTDEEATGGKTYYYKVVAVGENTESAQSGYVKCTGKCARPEVTAEANQSSGKTVLRWSKVSGAKKYTVYRADSENGTYKKLTTTTKTTYTDSKGTLGTEYFYKVVAVASSSKYNSYDSNIVSSTRICAQPEIKVTVDKYTGKPHVSWSKVSGATGYALYMSVNGGEFELLDVITTTTSMSMGIAEAGNTYRFAVQAVVEADASLNSAESISEPVLAACARLSITGARNEDGKPQISWEADAEAERYVIYRSTKSSGGYKAIGETDTDSYTDDSAKAGKTYYYKVVAVAGESESTMSGYVKIKSK